MLEREIENARDKTFEWGKFDCWLFVADCVKAMTGIDPAKGLRGNYNNEEDAEIVVTGYGGVDEMLEHMGFIKLENKLYAQRGDIVTLAYDWGKEAKIAGGICIGEKVLLASKEGLAEINLRNGKDAYKV